MILCVQKSDAIKVARLSALAIRNMVLRGVHMSAIKAANLHLERFNAAIDDAIRRARPQKGVKK